jgi:hypothetical protein
MSLVLHGANLKNSDWSPAHTTTSLDMSWRASKNVSQRQSVIHGDAHNQIQRHSNRPTTTSLPMEQTIAKPDFDVTSHVDALSIPVRPKTPTRPSKNDEAQKHEKTGTLYQSANFVAVDNNLIQLKSQNNFLSRKDPIFGERRKMHHAYLVAARNFSPPPQLWTKFSSLSTTQFSPGQKCQLHDAHDEPQPHHTSRMDLILWIFSRYKLAFCKISSR